MELVGHGSPAMNRAFETSVDTISDWQNDLLARHNWETVADRIAEGLR